MQSSCNKIQADLAAVLAERDRLYPQRDPANSAAMHAALDAYCHCLESLRSEREWQPEATSLAVAEKMLEHGVFLCGPMKSGTTLLLDLLDGHPGLNALPGDSFLRNIFSLTDQQSFRRQSWRQHWLKRFINPTGQKPFWLLGDDENAYVALLNYLDLWLDRLPDEYRRPVLATICSFFCANPRRSLEATRWVEKTPGNELHADVLLKHFPEARFIHIVRDPRENLASIKRLYRSRGWDFAVRGMTGTLARSFELAERNVACFGRDRYLVIRYEDLTGNPEAIMRNIAAFLAIEWRPSLLVPTVNGQSAKANSMYSDRQVTGVVRPSANDKWRQELTAYEQGVIYQLEGQVRRLGYGWTMNIADRCKRLACSWMTI